MKKRLAILLAAIVVAGGTFFVAGRVDRRPPTLDKPVEVVKTVPVKVKKSVPAPKPQSNLRIKGLGIWIYDLGKAEGGDPNRIAQKAKAHGIDYLIVNSHRGGKWFNHNPRGQVEKLIDVCRKAGIRIYLYQRCFGKNAKAEAEAAQEGLGMSDGYVLDMEVEFQSERGRLAAEKTLRQLHAWRDKSCPKKVIAVSTFAFRNLHAPMPWQAFDRYADVLMPQCYWVSFGTTVEAAIGRTVKEWNKSPCQIVLTAQAYGHRRGLKYVAPSELKKFIKLVGPSKSLNVFRWELMDEEHWQVLRKGG